MENDQKISKEDLLFELDEMIKNVERLPAGAMLQPITHYDYCALLMLIRALFNA